MLAQSETIDGGFADPVFDAQAVFKAVMDAMARPGTMSAVRPLAAPPQPLSPMAAAIALALCDHDTALWLDPALQGSAAVRSYLAFHTGAPAANTPSDAVFALVSSPAELMALENFAQGEQEYPDRSTTLIFQVDSLSSGSVLSLQGPGIETTDAIAPWPMPRHFAEQWKQNHARFPRGVDVILAAPDGIACLPRTTRIRMMEA
jgi:alpha-D-ribose 1-methylphosphonate 5-triphosphate synthase subunit PhnH